MPTIRRRRSQLRASVTVSWMMSSTSSWLLRIWCSRWIGEVDTKVWMRPCRHASPHLPQRSMSPGMARASPAMTAFFVCLAISARPRNHRPRQSESRLDDVDAHLVEQRRHLQLSSNVMVAPGDCSPSRNVVSKMMMSSCALLIGLKVPCHPDRKLVPAAYPDASRISIFRLM
jgi:hypothetical protein